MPEKDYISDPSSGSEDLGNEELETRGSGISGGTDTLTHMAALSAERKKVKDKASLKAKNEAEKIQNKNAQDDPGGL